MVCFSGTVIEAMAGSVTAWEVSADAPGLLAGALLLLRLALLENLRNNSQRFITWLSEIIMLYNKTTSLKGKMPV